MRTNTLSGFCSGTYIYDVGGAHGISRAKDFKTFCEQLDKTRRNSVVFCVTNVYQKQESEWLKRLGFAQTEVRKDKFSETNTITFHMISNHELTPNIKKELSALRESRRFGVKGTKFVLLPDPVMINRLKVLKNIEYRDWARRTGYVAGRLFRIIAQQIESRYIPEITRIFDLGSDFNIPVQDYTNETLYHTVRSEASRLLEKYTKPIGIAEIKKALGHNNICRVDYLEGNNLTNIRDYLPNGFVSYGMYVDSLIRKINKERKRILETA